MFLPDNINIVDTQTPIMVMVGSIGSGKTRVAYRLFEWLHSNGYRMEVDRVFRHPSDEPYFQFAKDFAFNFDSPYPVNPPRLALYQVQDIVGNPILQVFDAMGAEWFDANNHEKAITYSHQILQLFNSPNKKIWVYLTEPGWQDVPCRQSYVKSIHHLWHQNKKDKHIVLFNKIDRLPMPAERTLGLLHREYPGLLELFKNNNSFTSLFKPYYCALIPFITGYYLQENGRIVYCPGPDVYPDNLWKAIRKSIKH
jgi:hypothetical protein